MSSFNKRDVYFSIILPTHNEQQDILRTLKALACLEHDRYEVIVVDDDSTDHTVNIVRNFIQDKPHFRLLCQSQNRGVAAARNRGIKEAHGNVLVILNADVLLPPDFLKRIQLHYEEGKKWVSVECREANQASFLSRFTDARHIYTYQIAKKPWVWSEGFSCTKEGAFTVGLFPEDMPGCSGEDVDFGINLERDFTGIRDTSIVVPHIAPDTISAYWKQQRGRGQGRTNTYYYVRRFSKLKLFFNTLASSAKRIGKILLIFPLVIQAWTISQYSKSHRKDFMPFVVASYTTELAQLWGMWQAYLKIIKAHR